MKWSFTDVGAPRILPMEYLGSVIPLVFYLVLDLQSACGEGELF